MSERPGRREIEARLEETAESISNRFGAMERTVRPGGLASVRSLASMPIAKMVSVAAAGLLVGWVVARIGRRIFGGSSSREDWAEEVADLAMRERERGADERTALKRAIRDRAGSVPDGRGGGSGGWTSFILGYAVRTGIHTLISTLVGAWAKPEEADDGSAAA